MLTISLPPPTGSSRSPPIATTHSPSLANARRRMFAQQESNSCWVLLYVDIRAHTRRSSAALAHLHVCSTRCADCFAYSPPLQVRVGGFSPHAWSLTPAWRLFRTREGSNVLLPWYVRPIGYLIEQTSRFLFRRCLPRGMVAL